MLQIFLLLFQNSNSDTNTDTIDKGLDAGRAASKTVFEMARGFFEQLPLIGVGIVVFIVFLAIAYVVRKIIRTTARKAHFDDMLGSLLARIGYIIIIVFGLFVASTVIFPGVNAGDLIAGLGIGSVALGFAFKDVMQNLLAVFLILLYRPFKIGDQIKVDDFEGTVEEINVRATKIKTYDGERVVIPNSDLYMKSVLVRTAFPSRRTIITIGIGYNESHEEARKILMNVLKNTEGVLDEPAPDVNVVELADSSVNMKLFYWTDSFQSSTRKTIDRVVSASKTALDEAGIEIPFPQRVVEVVNKGFEIETSDKSENSDKKGREISYKK
ncbi:MAG: mechanosensitive ion channel family protein [Pyrinomonadaceae bacterium]